VNFGRSMMSVEHSFEYVEPGPEHDACSCAKYVLCTPPGFCLAPEVNKNTSVLSNSSGRSQIGTQIDVAGITVDLTL
jgi:hypothetical protein